MKRTIRNQPTCSFETLTKDKGIFDVRGEEESGEILNQSLSDSDSDRGLNDSCNESQRGASGGYSDDGSDNGWESFSGTDDENNCQDSNEETGCDYESPSDEDKDEELKSYVEMTNCEFSTDSEDFTKTHTTSDKPVVIDLDNGVTLETTIDLQEALENFTTVKCEISSDDDNFIKDLKSGQNLRFASEVFKMYLQSTPRRSSRHDNRTDICNLRINDEYIDKIVFKVPVFTDQSTGDPLIENSLFEFKAYVETGGKWKTIDAIFEDGYVKFSCCCMNSFCILSRPRQIEQEIRPEGGTFRCGNNVIIHIAKESVKSSKTISYEVKQPEIFDIHRQDEEWKPNVLVAVSDRIKMKNIKLSKPIVFSFPELQDKTYPESSDKQLIGFEGNKPYLLDIKPTEIEKRNFFKIKKCTGAALALVRRSEIRKVTPHQLKCDIDVFYGDRKACFLLLIYKTAEKGTITLLAEVVSSDQLKQRQNQYANDRLTLFRTSNMLFLLPLLRIRIVVSGRLILVPRKGGAHYFLNFIHASKSNMVEFKVNTNAGGVPYAVVKFKADNFDRKDLYSTHFELHELSKSRSFGTPR